MNEVAFVDKIRDVANREYSVDHYLIDDMLELFVPVVIDIYKDEVAEQVIAENHSYIFNEGKESARDEVMDLIRYLRKQGTFDDATLDEIQWSI